MATFASLSAATSAMAPTQLRTLRRRSSCKAFIYSMRTTPTHIVPPIPFYVAGSRMASFSTRLRSPPGSLNRREVLEHHGGGVFFFARGNSFHEDGL